MTVPNPTVGAVRITANGVNNFIGDIWVLAGVTDDAAYTTHPNRRYKYQFFKVTVTA